MVIVLDFYHQVVLIVSSSVECKVGSRPGQTGSQVSIAQLANKRLRGVVGVLSVLQADKTYD